MKLILSLLGCTFLYSGFAQQKTLNQAIIHTTTTIIAPDEDDVSNVQVQGGGGGFNFRNFGDGETKTTTYYKDAMMKTIMKTDMGRTTTIRNNDKKLTTTLIEMMGNKTGFYATDEDQEIMRKRMDSMMQANRNKQDSGKVRRISNAPATTQVHIAYGTETKKIAGYTAKKAYVIATRILGLKDTTVVWYTPDIKFENLGYTGGTSGFGAVTAIEGMDKIDGFILGYERNMRNRRKMVVEVTKIDIGKDIAAKEFDIPKDFDVKPMAEMQNMMRGMPSGDGNRQIRIMH